MTKLLTTVVAWALVLAPSQVNASKGLPEGVARFGMDLSASPKLDSEGLFTLTVWTWSNPEAAEKPATARIEVASGAEVVDGPTVRMLRPSEHWFWTVRLKRVGVGPVRIMGTLRIPGRLSGSYFFAKDVLELEVDASRLVARERRALQRMAVLGGRKLRYGGEYLVAIDDDETEDPVEVDSRPTLLNGSDILCQGCGLTAPVDVRLVVTVGKSGRVTWVRPQSVSDAKLDDRARVAIQNGLTGYRFQPALANGRPVADWAVVNVRVVPPERR